jgi:hypothetical protein
VLPEEVDERAFLFGIEASPDLSSFNLVASRGASFVGISTLANRPFELL